MRWIAPTPISQPDAASCNWRPAFSTGGWRDVMGPDIIPIAKTTGGAPVVFSRNEHERHIYVVGKSGSGKSTFLYNLALRDIWVGEGVAVIDPHGDLALDILDAIPRSRI
jgi:DNA helicase HerA-like ATPase